MDDQFLKKYDLKPDHAYPIDYGNNNSIFEEIENKNTVVRAMGGSVTNTIQIFSQFPNVKGLFLGCIGRDEHGKFIKNTLHRLKGIDLTGLVEKTGGTGKVAVLLVGECRTLVTDLGASQFFSLANLLETCLWEKVIESRFLYVSVSIITGCLNKTTLILIIYMN